MTTAIEPVKRCNSRWCSTDECVVEIDAAAISAAEHVWDKLDCVDWEATKKATDEDDILRIAHAIVSARTPAPKTPAAGEPVALREALERNQDAIQLALGTMAMVLARFQKRCATGISGPLDKGECLNEGHGPTEHTHLRALRIETERMQKAHDDALVALAAPAAREEK